MVPVMPLQASVIADVILAKAAARGEHLSSMKLQKLLYYVQGEHLAATGELLFNEPIKAWKKGPVVPEIWHRHGRQNYAIPAPQQVPEISAFYEHTISCVIDRYLPFTAEQLSEMTHREPPWRNARAKKENSARISPASLVDYFGKVRAARMIERPTDTSANATKARVADFVQRHALLFQRLS
jgi:uncharacterized phage-associated protein